MTPLLHASRAGAVGAVRALIVAKACIYAPSTHHDRDHPYEYTALDHACRMGHHQVVELLLEADAASGVRGDYATSICIAAKAGHLSAVLRLLAAGADVTPGDDVSIGWDPLLMASKMGHVPVVAALLEANADPNAEAYYNGTALHLAAKAGKADVIRVLVAAGADVNRQFYDGDDDTPLASARGSASATAALLAAGADPNIPDCDHCTPLHCASIDGADDVVTLLLAAGADVHARMNGGTADRGLTALTLAQRGRNRHEKLDTVALLLAAGAVDEEKKFVVVEGTRRSARQRRS